MDNLSLEHLKHHKKTVTSLDKGNECGLSFNQGNLDLQKGDIIECYVTEKKEGTKFVFKPGVFKNF